MVRWLQDSSTIMRKAVILVSVALSVGSAFAEDVSKSSETNSVCVDVQIGDDRSAYLNCLNDEFQRRVRLERQSAQIDAPIGVHSSPNQVEGFNETAAREQMGSSFGISAVPQRPKPVFVSPLLPAQTH